MNDLAPRTRADLEAALRKNVLRTIAAHVIGFPLDKLTKGQIQERFGKYGEFKKMKLGTVEDGATPLTEWELRAILHGDQAKDDDHFRNQIHREYREALNELGSSIRGDALLEMATFAATDLVPLGMAAMKKKMQAVYESDGYRGGQILVQMLQEMRNWIELGGIDVKRDDAAELREHLASLRDKPAYITQVNHHYHNPDPPVSIEREEE